MEFESLRYPSVCLAKILEKNKAIGTEKEVTFRRKMDQMHSYIDSWNKYHDLIYSGSRGEGLRFQTSDHDIMLPDRVTVWDSEKDRFVVQKYSTVVMMRRNECNPGFVLLELISGRRETLRKIWNSTVEYEKYNVVSSVLYRDEHFYGAEGFEPHGPCITHKQGDDEFDYAHCFSCPLWPTEAYPFIHRLRPFHWPNRDLLDSIIRRGCHVVPIGDKGSDISHIQWRLSFSAAEKALVHSFNHTQLKVYVLLKIFLKQVIDKIECTKGLLCSYFLKTAVFYSAEQTPVSLWRDDLTIICFWFCLNKLIQWIEQGYCPNYFVPENNMFRNKIYGEHQMNLLRVLKRCKGIGWKCLYGCEDLQSLERCINRSCSKCVKYLFEKNVDNIFIERSECFSTIFEVRENIKRSLTFWLFSRSQLEIDVSNTLISNLFANMAELYASQNLQHNMNNKRRYLELTQIERILSNSRYMYIGRDSYLLATIYYITGRYRKAVQICEDMISKWKHVDFFGISCREYLPCSGRQFPGQGRQTFNDIVTKRMAAVVSVRYETTYVFPKELYDVASTSHQQQCFHLPPLPYTVFLSFLCHNKLGNIDKSFYALHNLRALLDDSEQGCKCRCKQLHDNDNYILLYLLAVCLEKVGNVNEAIQLCLLLQDLKPELNCSSVFISKMLSRD